VGAITKSNRGPVIVLMHQYILVDDGTSIHSSPQMEGNQVSVDDWSQYVGGHQCLLTLNGYQIPLNMCHGLACMDMYPFTKDRDGLLHIALTLETPWLGSTGLWSWSVWWPQLVQACQWPPFAQSRHWCTWRLLLLHCPECNIFARWWGDSYKYQRLYLAHMGISYWGHPWYHCWILCPAG
jgi:hypothetical protein